MRITLLLLSLMFALAFTAHAQGKRWTETPDETIWRERYGNCDHGYFVDLPPGVIGHASHPPSTDHGILISTKNPGVATEVTLEEPRLVDVYDSIDAEELGSPGAYIEKYELKPKNTSARITILERRDTKFRGSRAVYIHYRKTMGNSTSEIEELVVYRVPKFLGPSFYVVMLRTTPEFYARDHVLYLQIRDGLTFVRIPRGECSNN
jgi:hypothetical protein